MNSGILKAKISPTKCGKKKKKKRSNSKIPKSMNENL
jgi:hypothetical protein